MTPNPWPGNLSGIYVFTCRPTGKIYVGSAKKLRNRFLNHRKILRLGTHPNYRFQQAWIKHGEESFDFRVLLVCEPKDLLMYEQRAFDILNPTINVLKIAGSSLGRIYTPQAYANIVAGNRKRGADPEIRARMSAAAKGRTFSPEHKEKLRAALKGRSRPRDVIEKIIATKALKRGGRPPAKSSPNKGRGRAPDWKERIAALMRVRVISAETRAKMSA